VRTTAARLLRRDQLLVAPDAVYKIAKVEYPIPLNLVSVELTNQMTTERSTRDFRWDQLLSTEEPYEVKFGETDKVTVELALLSDADRSHVYRYDITDAAAGIDYKGADLRLNAQRPSNVEAAQALLDFLGAAGEAYWTELNGCESDNGDLFPAAIKEWSYLNAEEISTAAIGLSEARGAER
jgi:hypothetical protein